jgi:hypothetical protein
MTLTYGSLKELADAYGITYPTVRPRLDRLNSREDLGSRQNDTADDHERLPRALRRGRFDASTFTKLLKHYQQNRTPTMKTSSSPHFFTAAAAPTESR